MQLNSTRNFFRNRLKGAKENLATVDITLRRNFINLVLEVKDNGPHNLPNGLKENLARKIRFTNKKDGNGIGLLHAKKVAEASDGCFKIKRTAHGETVATLIFQIND